MHYGLFEVGIKSKSPWALIWRPFSHHNYLKSEVDQTLAWNCMA